MEVLWTGGRKEDKESGGVDWRPVICSKSTRVFVGGINEKDHDQCLASQAGMLLVACVKLGVFVQV